MKKSLLTLAIIAAAAVSQAASLNWSILNVKTAADSTAAANGYTAMLFMLEQTSSADGFVNFGKANTTVSKVTELADAGKYDDLLALAVATANTANGAVSTQATGYNGNNFAAGDSLKGFAIVISDDKSKYFLTGEKSASWTSGTGAKPLAFGNVSGATYKNFGVPEPATGALALAGIALLFRRRK